MISKMVMILKLTRLMGTFLILTKKWKWQAENCIQKITILITLKHVFTYKQKVDSDYLKPRALNQENGNSSGLVL